MASERLQHGIELWGGAECTINRVRDQYFDQLGRTGHVRRTSDFERFAALGIKALRQPILWECSPSHASRREQWEWARVALSQLTSLGIRPIVGLLHHGSGPSSTNLLDPNLPEQLARYAQQVAIRFPEVEDYIPVNEPLTTARFSALYGHWYPHSHDERSFVRALLNECRGVVLAMDEIRRVNPSARLIQTDDLGKVYSTPALAYQAEFENERRWSTFDLLCGRVDRDHRMWHHFRWAGIPEPDLEWFLEHPCPPDVIGVNIYLSGERYLDENRERYPPETHGGNGKHQYADVLASRVMCDGTPGPEALLLECWERYQRPIAVTECHNGCTREEQLRWFLAVWRAAEKVRQHGADVLAVTAWSLLGSFDWNSLVTQKNDQYEPGIYDVRSTPPRSTAIAKLIYDLATTKQISIPVLEVPGWWRRPRRFEYGFSIDNMGTCGAARSESINSDYPNARPILITDSNSSLGRSFVHLCELRGIPYRTLERQLLETDEPLPWELPFHELNPWAVIDAGAFTRVSSEKSRSGRDFRKNRSRAPQLLQECKERGVRFLSFSSDLVFDGNKGAPYIESDAIGPLNDRGCSQAESEKLVQSVIPEALIVRSGPLLGPFDQTNFVVRALRCLAWKQPFAAANDVVLSPTYIPDLVDACLDLLIDAESGIWHLSNVGQVSWASLAAMAARLAKISFATFRSCTRKELGFGINLPKYSALTSERAILLPTLEESLSRYTRECETFWQSQLSSEMLAA